MQRFKFFLVASFLLCSFSSMGEIVNFDIKLKYGQNSDVKKVKYQIRSKLGEDFHIERNGLQIILKAEKLNYLKTSKDLLHISGKVFEIKDGVEKMIAEPELVTRLNEDTTLRVSESDNFFELNLFPSSI